MIAVGLNYADHIAEMKRTPLGTPLIWFKAPSSLLPHNGTIEIAFPEHQTDFEVELAIVIGRTAKNVSVEQALDFIFGYTIGLDISDRDLQKSEKQFGRCKSFDTYTPIGPFVYSDVDVRDLAIELRQNGEMRQRARTSQMIYPVGGDRFVRQPIAHLAAGRCDLNRNAVRRRADSRGGRTGSADWRLAAVAKSRGDAQRDETNACIAQFTT